jgi:hypothetical protein
MHLFSIFNVHSHEHGQTIGVMKPVALGFITWTRDASTMLCLLCIFILKLTRNFSENKISTASPIRGPERSRTRCSLPPRDRVDRHSNQRTLDACQSTLRRSHPCHSILSYVNIFTTTKLLLLSGEAASSICSLLSDGGSTVRSNVERIVERNAP